MPQYVATYEGKNGDVGSDGIGIIAFIETGIADRIQLSPWNPLSSPPQI
jgi:hypothetical protein